MEGQWFFSRHMTEPLVQFFHPEIHIWVNMNHKASIQVGAFDLLINIGYVIHADEEHKTSIGEKRLYPDGFETLLFEHRFYMTENDREEMHLLLQRAEAMRNGKPMQEISFQYWSAAVAKARYLPIIMPGELVSPELARIGVSS
jgi:hypothetical protein